MNIRQVFSKVSSSPRGTSSAPKLTEHLLEKQFVRVTIDRLIQEIVLLLETPAPSRDQHWHAQCDARISEARYLLISLFPSNSPILELANARQRKSKALGHESTQADDPVKSRDSDSTYALEVLRNLLVTAARVNELRSDADSNRLLSDDIDRVLARRFISHPFVLVCFAMLIGAVGFAMVGVVKINGLEMKLSDQIDQAATQAKKQISEERTLVLSELEKERTDSKAIGDQLDTFHSQLAKAKEEVTSLAQETRAAMSGLDASLSEEARKAVRGMEDDARKSISAGKEATQANISAAAKDAVKDIQEAAQLRANAIKSMNTPEFDALLAKDQEQLRGFDRRIDALGEKAKVITIAQNLWLKPDSTIAAKLSEYFSLTIRTVYWVLVALSVLLIANVFLVIAVVRGKT